MPSTMSSGTTTTMNENRQNWVSTSLDAKVKPKLSQSYGTRQKVEVDLN